MICYKFQNIKELKADKVTRAFKASTMSSLDKFLLNVSSDQVEVPANFDSWSWPENMSSEDTS